MFQSSLKAVLLPLVLATAACSEKPMSVSHSHDTKDGTHRAVQFSMHTGVYGTPVQTVMVLYNKWTPHPVATVSGQSKRLSGQLVDALLALGPSVIAGEYLIKAEKIGCPQGTLCGTLVQVNAQAGAEADASSASGSDS